MRTLCEAGRSRRDTRDPLRLRSGQALRQIAIVGPLPLPRSPVCLLSYYAIYTEEGPVIVEHWNDNRVIVGQGSLMWWRRLIVQKGLFHGKLAACGSNHFLCSA